MTDLTPAHPLTLDQRNASDPARSAWVSANAGTGKTQVLTARILRLLLNRVPASEILCLTYTKAAAAEMQNRLNARLAKWAAMRPVDLTRDLEGLLGRNPTAEERNQAQHLFADVADAPDGIKIRTIHAFCEGLLGRFPLEAGLAPHFQVIDEVQARSRLRDARDRFIDQVGSARETDLARAFDLLVTRLDENAFEALVAALTTRRALLDRHLRTVGGDIETLIGVVHDRLGTAPGMTEADIIQTAPPPDEAGLRGAVDLLRAHGTPKADHGLAARLERWLNMDTETRIGQFFDVYGPAFLKADGAPKADSSLGTKKAHQAAPHLADLLRQEQSRVAEIRDRCLALEMADMTAAALRVGLAITLEYETIKANRAELDYDDLIGRALGLLEGDGRTSWVHYKLDGGLAHILLDEAQDTAPDQWRLLELLSNDFFTGEGAWPDDKREVRTLFVVGDQKQSIYSFQGADPETFDAERLSVAERITEGGGDARFVAPSIQLALSFRSVQAVMQTVDTVFEPDAIKDGLVARNAPTAQQVVRHQTNRALAPGLVELWPPVEPIATPAPEDADLAVDQPETGNAPDRLAQHIAATIKGWLSTGEVLESKGRPITEGDILILVRDRRQVAKPLITALKQRGVNVAGSDRLQLTDHIAVLDLMALGQFVLLPDDDLTLATVLKSPLGGLDDDDLISLAPERAGTLWRALQNRADERVSWKAATNWLSDLLALADQCPPFEFFSKVLTSAHGRQRLLSRLGPDAEDPIDEFLGQALLYERDHPPSLEGFLHHLRQSQPTVKREMDSTDDAVRVMTVHGAKGMEAPIVFLINNKISSRGGGPKGPALLFDHGDNAPDGGPLPFPFMALSKADSPAAGLEMRAAHDRDSAREDRRLLYVGLTRAEDRLYLAAHGVPAEDSWHRLVEDGLKAAGAMEIQIDGETGYRLESGQVPDHPPSQEIIAPSQEELPDWAKATAQVEPDPPAPLSPSRPDQEPPGLSPFAGEDTRRFQRGLLIHKLLQLLPEVAIADRRPRAQALLAQPAHDLSAAAQAEILDETLGVLEDPAFAPLFGPGSLAEVPVTGTLGGRVISARLDRLLVTPDAVWALDFKTNRPPPMRPEDVAPAYLKQMAGYRAALRLIYPDREIKSVLLWTDGPRLMPLEDALLDPWAPDL